MERRSNPVQGRPSRRDGRCGGRPGLPPPRSPSGSRHVRRHTHPLAIRPKRKRTRLRPLPVQTGLAGSTESRSVKRPSRGHAVRRHEHSPHRRRRLRPSSVRRPNPRNGPRTSSPSGATGRRPNRRSPHPLANRTSLQLLGLPSRHVPPGPWHAHRPDPGLSPSSSSDESNMDRPQGEEGNRPKRPRPSNSRPRRSPRRRHRPGGPTPISGPPKKGLSKAPSIQVDMHDDELIAEARFTRSPLVRSRSADITPKVLAGAVRSCRHAQQAGDAAGLHAPTLAGSLSR